MIQIKQRATVKNILDETVRELEKREIDDPHLNAEILLSWVLKEPRPYLYLNSGRMFPPLKISLLKKLIKKRSSHIPLSYLMEEQNFMGLKFRVTSAVYIPRPETEILVEKAVKILQEKPIFKDENIIVELGTGCGNISISLAKQLNNFKLYAVEISRDALRIAHQNAQRYKVERKINFLWGDLFSPLRKINLKGRVRLIISNPPYIPSLQIKKLPLEVKKEPSIALDGGEDGLKFYRRIIQSSPYFLEKEGIIALEIGYNQAKRIEKLIVNQPEFKSPEFIQDYGGIQRVIISRRR